MMKNNVHAGKVDATTSAYGHPITIIACGHFQPADMEPACMQLFITVSTMQWKLPPHYYSSLHLNPQTEGKVKGNATGLFHSITTS
jgi:hypothetical protein